MLGRHSPQTVVASSAGPASSFRPHREELNSSVLQNRAAAPSADPLAPEWETEGWMRRVEAEARHRLKRDVRNFPARRPQPDGHSDSAPENPTMTISARSSDRSGHQHPLTRRVGPRSVRGGYVAS